MRLLTRLIILIVLLTLTWTSSKGQVKQVVMHFDTLISKDFYQDFYIHTQGQKQLYPYLQTDSFCKQNYSKKSLTCNLKILSDSSTIRISLDQKGGYLELKNVYNQLHDTIRIRKHEVIDIHYPDTNRTTIHYFYLINDTLGNHFKTKKIYSIEKLRKIDKVPYKTSYFINNHIYECSATWQYTKNEVNVTNFHGRGKKGIFKRRPFYFHGKTIHSNTYNVITIQLKNGIE